MRFDETTFLSELREPKADPGGGSTAAYVEMVALALVEKICVLEILRAKKSMNDHKNLDNLLRQVRLKSDSLKSLVENDVLAYERLAASIKDGLRWPENCEMVTEAIESPYHIILGAIDSLQLISDIGCSCRHWLIPDVLVALELTRASAKAAFHIAIANLDHIEETTARQSRAEQLESAFRRAERYYSRVLESFKDNQGPV
ncbi:MAG: cyclodeaminase/cyclohydrolase family protein [Desulfomonilaceae bacterium]